MKPPEQDRPPRQWRRIWKRFFLRMLLAAFLLIISVLILTGYAIAKYRQDFSSDLSRSCDMIISEFERYNEENPEVNPMDGYVPTGITSASRQTGLCLYLYDADGTCLCTAGGGTDTPIEQLKPNNEMMQAVREDGECLSDDTSDKIDRSIAEPMVTCGKAFSMQIDGTESDYYLFAASRTQQLNVFTTRIILVAVAIVSVFLAAAAVWNFYLVWQENKKLEQLEDAMQRYALDDYNVSLPVEAFVGTDLERIAELAERIGTQSARAEEASRQFVSNVSHELRTPMTIISGFVEGILDGTVPKNKRMEYLSIVSQEVQRLKMLVTSMLNLTKFDAGTIQINYRRFTINDTAFRTILMFENRLEKRNISVEGLDGEPIRVCADPDLMGQVIYNLVENAVKFVNDGGTITFTFAETEEYWSFAIRNTGNGISKEELPKIFERFYKSDASRSQDKTGLGLGLDITRKIIHLHNAQISVRSEEHTYTEFEVRLPHVELPEQEA